MHAFRVRLILCALSLAPVIAGAQPTAQLPLKRAAQPTAPAINAADLMSRLYVFADDSLMGREAGTEYNLKGTAYIEREVRRLGLVPAGDNGTYFQNLPIVNRPLAPDNSITAGGKKFVPSTDYMPRDNTQFGGVVRPINGTQIVYGGTFGRDTTKMISPRDAAGKFIVMSLPVDAAGKTIWSGNRQPLTGYLIDAAGIAVVGFDAIPAAERAPLLDPTQAFKNTVPDQQLPAYMYVSQAMAEALMGAPLAGLSRGAPGGKVQGELRYDEVPAPGRNVVAILPGSDPALKGQYIAIGAHNDHVGFNHLPVDHDSIRAYNGVIKPRGEDDPDRAPNAEEWAKIKSTLDSLRKLRAPRLDSIFNGADDDGTGSVAALEIAEAFATGPVKPKRSLLFVWHAGEEKGLWGSEYFTDHPTVPRDSIVAQLNMDMIGRGGPLDLPDGGPGYLQLIGTRRLSTELGDIMESVGKAQPMPFKFDYQYDANGHPQQYYCRSDHYSYARYGIPIAFVSTGGHRDYHELTDEPQYIDYDQLTRVANLMQAVALKVANLDHRLVVDKPKPDPKGQCRQ